MFAPSVTTPLDDESPILEGLNAEQRTAVVHDGAPLLVVAGAGSGKTRTLASRVAWLIEQGMEPERLLLLTFTRRAAADMLRRAGSLVATGDRSAAAGKVWGGTFHAVANRLIRRYAASVGLDPGFTVLDQSDSESLFGIVRTELGVAEQGRRFPRKETIATVYSRTVNEQCKLDEVLRRRFSWCQEHADGIREVIGGYRQRKREHQVLDYDDLLLYWRALLEGPAGETVQGLFDHVLVDEFQDTNPIQGDILRRMCGERGNLTVVGDDAQAIYGFRAASADNIRNYPTDYNSATVVALEQNYRSTPQILAAANAVIAQSSELYPKRLRATRPDGPRPRLVTCFDEAAQADWVCDRVLEHREAGIPLREQAVLFRTGHHSDGLELELARRKIPFVKYGGLKFLEAAHIKDLLATLRILDNPHDEMAWHRVLDSLPGVGPATAQRLLDQARQTAAADGVDATTAFCSLRLTLPADTVEPFGELQAALREARGGIADREPPPAMQIDRLIGFCKLVFERKYDDVAVRLGDIEQLASLASQYATRSRFLTELTLDPPVSTSELAGPPHLDDDYLVLSTIHSAKGGEWRSVFVINASDGNIPSDMALGEPGGVEEERRLLYVAMTRAEDHLEVSFPQRFYHRRFSGDDRHSYAPLSRFLSSVTDHFDTATAAPQGVDDTTTPTPVGADPVDGLLDELFS